MSYKALALTAMFAVSTLTAMADKKGDEYQKSYNYKRGVELLLDEQAFLSVDGIG